MGKSSLMDLSFSWVGEGKSAAVPNREITDNNHVLYIFFSKKKKKGFNVLPLKIYKFLHWFGHYIIYTYIKVSRGTS